MLDQPDKMHEASSTTSERLAEEMSGAAYDERRDDAVARAVEAEN